MPSRTGHAVFLLSLSPSLILLAPGCMDAGTFPSPPDAPPDLAVAGRPVADGADMASPPAHADLALPSPDPTPAADMATPPQPPQPVHGLVATTVWPPSGPAHSFVTVSGSGFQQGDTVVISGANLPQTSLSTITLTASAIVAELPALNVALPSSVAVQVSRAGALAPQAGLPFKVTSGRVFTIASNGSDGAAGTMGSPWATISGALSKMAPGDVAYVRGGTYAHSVNTSVSGTANAPITIAGHPGETALVTNSSSNTLDVKGSYLTFDNLHITDTASAIAVAFERGATNIVMSNCEVYGSVNSGIVLSSSQSLLYRNTIHDNGTRNALDHGVYLEGDHNVLRSNTFYDNASMGIQIYNGHTDANGTPYATGSNIIEYNYFYHNGWTGSYDSRAIWNADVYVGAGNTSDNVVRYNRMCGNHYAMFIWGKPTGTQIESNVSCDQGSGGFYMYDAGAGTSLKGNVSYDEGGSSLLLIPGVTSDDNVAWKSGGTPTFSWNDSAMSLTAYQAASGQDRNTRIADPRFTNAPAGSFDIAKAATYDFCTTMIPQLCAPLP